MIFQFEEEPHIVLVDMDGVLADYTAGFNRRWQEWYPGLPFIAPDKQRRFYLAEEYPEELRPLAEAIESSPGFYQSLPPIEGAIEAVRELDSLPSVRVMICSSPRLESYQYCIPEKYDWIREYLGDEFIQRLILTKDKTLVHGRFLIDDKPFIIGVRTPTWMQLIFDRPYNREEPGRRISWSDYRWLLNHLPGKASGG